MDDSRVAHINAKPVPASDLLAPEFDSRLRRDRVADDYDSGADDAAVDAAVPDEGDDRGSQPQQGMIAEEGLVSDPSSSSSSSSSSSASSEESSSS